MHTNKSSLIEGNTFSDERGSVIFCNDFMMEQVKRMYIVAPSSTQKIRAWQGHKVEQKWFFCLSGSFEIKIVKVNDFVSPANNLPVSEFFLNSELPQVLHVPGGFANGIRAASPDSRLIIYSNFAVEESGNDDFRFDINTWNGWNA